MTYLLLKYVHVIGASVLLGTGAGIAFFMLLAHLTGNAATIAAVARIVVIADFVFTATAVVVQPVTGVALAWHMGWSLWEGWIALSIVLYFVTGAFWLPSCGCRCACAIWPLRLPPPAASFRRVYHRLFWWWFAFGFPAFGAVLAIFWLMIAKPQLGWP